MVAGNDEVDVLVLPCRSAATGTVHLITMGFHRRPGEHELGRLAAKGARA